ncbi:hypothetical protein [Crassaminicella profunda]|uniref:hypothetical protein n=1 Tax=Crassaminicella profunda TaxID=1286698 RepID=UPI001CA746D0|nr:hypothetical protein [Crassaminicella profunda]QZY55106.1 hypothetical protein K7H06_19220 [Crassaminicella profunda]
MKEKIFLDMLTQDSVSIRKQQLFVDGNIEYSVGQPWRCAYSNTVQGRQQVESEVVEPYKSAIFALWGDTPTLGNIAQ